MSDQSYYIIDHTKVGCINGCIGEWIKILSKGQFHNNTSQTYDVFIQDINGNSAFTLFNNLIPERIVDHKEIGQQEFIHQLCSYNHIKLFGVFKTSGNYFYIETPHSKSGNYSSIREAVDVFNNQVKYERIEKCQ